MNVSMFLWCTLPTGSLLVILGFLILIYVIPKAGKRNRDSESRTEFYSVRAAYWCVIAGLLVLLTVTISMATHYAICAATGGK
jgi:hypothetical protein